MNGGKVMQFCPRCGSKNQDGRASCWKCLGQLQKADSKKAQLIVLPAESAPASGFQPVVEPEPAQAAAVPIPELAEIEPEPLEPEPVAAPAFDLPAEEPVLEPVAEEPAPQVADLGDVMIPSPTFGGGAEDADSEEPPQAVPILGLANFPENEAAAEPSGFGEVEDAPGIEVGVLSDETLAVDDSPADADDGVPWWLAQDDTEDDASAAGGSPVLDLDDGGLEIIPPDDAGNVFSLDDEEDQDSRQ